MTRLLPVFLVLLCCTLQNALHAQWQKMPDALRKRSETTSVVYGGKLYTFLGFADGALNPEPSSEVYDPQTNSWSLLANIPAGKAITHQGVLLIDDDVWHVGGRVGKHPGPLTHEIWIYNIPTNTWRQGPSILNPANGSALPWGGGGVALIGRTLHLFGGFVYNACNNDNDRFHLTLDVDAWRSNPAQPAPWKNEHRPMPLKRNHFATVVMGGKIYAIGGQFGHDCRGGRDQHYSHVYDPSSDSWAQLPNLPAARSHVEGSTFAMDGKIYVVAGQTDFNVNTNAVTVFDPKANNGAGAWANSTELELPKVYEGLSAKHIGNVVYATHGGEGASTRTRKTGFVRTVTRNPVYQLDFGGSCVNLNLKSGATAALPALLYSWEGTADFSTVSSAPWLVVKKNASGKVSPNGVSLEMEVNTAGLEPGQYNATVTATGSEGGIAYTAGVYCIQLRVNASKADLKVPAELVFSGVQGRQGKTRQLTLRNDGTEELVISSLNFTGSHGEAFRFAQPTELPIRVGAGQNSNLNLVFAPPAGMTGALQGTLEIGSNDAGTASQSVRLYGVSAKGEQGNNEPPLDAIVKTLGYKIDVGGTGLILGTSPKAIGDEVLQPLFRKAGTGAVTLKPVARYSPDDLLPFGYYTTKQNQPTLHQVGVLALSNEQTLYPELESGSETFDPGDNVFGLYTGATSYARQPTYTEDTRNTGPLAHAVRIYPLVSRTGQPISNSYLVAFEPASNGDYQDYVFVVENVQPVSRPGGGVLEAELALLSGAGVSSNNVGYSGSGFADFRHLSGDYVQWTLNMEEASTVALSFRYANGQRFTKPCRLIVNGQIVQRFMDFAPTGTWADWELLTVNVGLVEGANTIRLEAYDRVGPDLDYLAWQLTEPEQAGILEAEVATLSGPIVSVEHDGYTGTGYADFQNVQNDYIEWTLPLEKGGDVTLSFNYANGSRGNRPLQLSINGQALPVQLVFAPTGGWEIWQQESITLSLDPGTNYIRLSANGSSGANIDHLSWQLTREEAGRIAARGTAIEMEQSLTASISPNPAISTARLSVQTRSNLPIEVSVFDLSGRLQRAQVFRNDTQGVIELPVSTLAPGVYLVRIKQGAQETTTRMMVGRK